MSIEKNFNIKFISTLALKEKQIQQNYRPIIAVHKWFARRPGTLFRGLLLSEFSDLPVTESYYTANNFPGKKVVDPFMGGGTPLLEANRIGCDIEGFDINPMATWIVKEEIENLDLLSYKTNAEKLVTQLSEEIGQFYKTDCPLYGDADVPVKYYLWVKTLDCEHCGINNDLFPGYLLAEDVRHTSNIVICPCCGDLNDVSDLEALGPCNSCGSQLATKRIIGKNYCDCKGCGQRNFFPKPERGPLKHRMFAIEYYNPQRKKGHKGRFFKKPDDIDIGRYEELKLVFSQLEKTYIPQNEILPGDETDRLHKWGYSKYNELFNERQLLGLEISCRIISTTKDQRIKHALATNLSDLLRYQNLLCRYDTMALKSLDIFSIHGFPVGLVQCESNLLGFTDDDGKKVGSGGWINIIEKFIKAKQFCDAPFEIKHNGKKKVIVPIPEERIGYSSASGLKRSIEINCSSSTEAQITPGSVDAVFTDPPYFENVQYGELMDFCYVWLRGLIGESAEGFNRPSTRSEFELTGNVTQSKGLTHYTEGLSAVYSSMATALKPDAPLVFTFHHNRIDPYYAIGIAILDSGFICTKSIPCPAEMGGSIHIHGTQSSIIDTVFVCRSPALGVPEDIFNCKEELREIIKQDLTELTHAGVKVSQGDIRCIIYGHLTRVAVWNLHADWTEGETTIKKIELISKEINSIGKINDLFPSLAEEMNEFRKLIDQRAKATV